MEEGKNFIEKFFDSKNKEFEFTRKLVNKDFVIKAGLIGALAIILVLNTFFEVVTKIGGIFSGGDKPSIFGILNFTYMLYGFPIYLFFLVIYSIVFIKLVLKMKTAFNEIEDGQKGTARFATREEIASQYKAVPIKDEPYNGGGGIPIARSFIDENNNIVNYKEDKDKEKNKKIMEELGIKEVMYIDDSSVNNLIIGTTRSGKGETFVVPSIDIYSRAEKKASLIVNDPKGELIAMSKETLEERGYEVLLLNLTDPLNSMSYNPLELIIQAYERKDFGEAQLLCQTLTYSIYADPTAKDAFWQNTAMSLTNALILALCEEYIPKEEKEKITLYNVAKMLSELGKTHSVGSKKEVYYIDEYFESLPKNCCARLQYSTAQFAKESTKASIFVSAMNKLNMFTFDKIAKMTSKNSLNFEEIGFGDGKPKAIFMVTPDYDKSIHVLASIFVRQVYYVLAKKSTLSESGKCDREVIFLLDEFGNMPPIEGMANIITVCLGRGIRFNLIIQAYNQLKTLYGDDSATIEGNCGNQIYILTNDDETAEKFSKLIGEKTIISQSRSGEMYSIDKSHSENLDARRLLKSDELRKLKEGEMIVVRVIKRKNRKNEKIVPNPIFNNNDYCMKYRYEYLTDTFDNSKSFMNIRVESLHNNIKLSKQMIDFLQLIEENNRKRNKENISTNRKILGTIKSKKAFKIIETKTTEKDVKGLEEIKRKQHNRQNKNDNLTKNISDEEKQILKNNVFNIIKNDANKAKNIEKIIDSSNTREELYKNIKDEKIIKQINIYLK